MDATENRPVNDEAALEEFGGSTIEPNGSNPVSPSLRRATGAAAASQPIMSPETIVSQTVSAYLTSISDDPTVSLTTVRDVLLQRINAEFTLENAGRGGKRSPHPTIPLIQALDEYTVAMVLLARHRIVAVDLAEGDADDMTLLAVYVDFGDEAGTYSTAESRIKSLASELKPSLSSRGIDSVYARLRMHAPVVRRTTEPHLIAVANGVYDHVRATLREFSPDWIFLSKIPIDYDPSASSPVISMHDGAPWTVDSWIESLSDDAGVPDLLWELIGAGVRSSAPWGKAIWFVSERGNNGKGTFIQLLRNLLGSKACSSVPFTDFGQPFLMEPLLHSRVNLVDENDVGKIAERIAFWKAVVTGDAFNMDRKHKTPVKVRWRGLDIQCHNSTLQKTKDRSGSFYRRLLIVPFRKWFGGDQRTYIKDDYLARPDVLRYVLKRGLEMTHTTLSVPPACAQALEDYKGDNNYMLTFWQEFADHFVWDLLPYRFLHALYCAWLRRTNPSARPEGQAVLTGFLREHLADSDVWEVKRVDVRPGSTMSAPEKLIAEYDLVDWTNGAYGGADPAKRSIVYPLAQNYKGLLRRVPAPVPAATTVPHA